jgi:hypothetical protein
MDDAGYDSDGDLVLSLVPGLAEGLSAAAAEAEACVFLSFFFFFLQFDDDDGHALGTKPRFPFSFSRLASRFSALVSVFAFAMRVFSLVTCYNSQHKKNAQGQEPDRFGMPTFDFDGACAGGDARPAAKLRPRPPQAPAPAHRRRGTGGDAPALGLQQDGCC